MFTGTAMEPDDPVAVRVNEPVRALTPAINRRVEAEILVPHITPCQLSCPTMGVDSSLYAPHAVETTMS